MQARVLSGEIVRGTRLPQEALAAEFGVSRTPVREALRKLQASGVVEVLPNRGAVVRGPSAREIRESYEVRTELEGLAAELATARMGDAPVLGLREAEELFRTSVGQLVAGPRRSGNDVPWDEHDAWVRANDRFHQAILEAAGEPPPGGRARRPPPELPPRAHLVGAERELPPSGGQRPAAWRDPRRDRAPRRRRRTESIVARIRTAGELVLHYFETVGEPPRGNAARHPVIGRRPNARVAGAGADGCATVPRRCGDRRR